MPDTVDKPWGVRPTWRRWQTEEELADLGQIRNYLNERGEVTGWNMGVWYSRTRVRVHTDRSRRKDARWAKRNGCVIDAKGIIRRAPDGC